MGKSTGLPCTWWLKPGFAVDFPVTQWCRLLMVVPRGARCASLSSPQDIRILVPWWHARNASRNVYCNFLPIDWYNQQSWCFVFYLRTIGLSRSWDFDGANMISKYCTCVLPLCHTLVIVKFRYLYYPTIRFTSLSVINSYLISAPMI